jgi:penicillin G amidase
MRCALRVLVAVLVALPTLNLSAAGHTADPARTTLDVGGELVRIYRDEFGVPHIFARTNRGLFEAYGYVVAQDRLWQLELFRRAARGRLAEIFGPGVLIADVTVRTAGYTDAELDSQFTRLDAEEREIFHAYIDGINRYVAEVVAPDPLAKLPFEFHALDLGVPARWTVRDSVAVVAFMARQFGEIGGGELLNQALLQSLITAHGSTAGQAIFNDVRWLNDPDAPVTVPSEGAVPRAQSGVQSTASPPRVHPAQLRGASQTSRPDLPDGQARKIWESLGIPTRLGSYAWVVSEDKSAGGAAMLYGGPQMGFNAPEILHEVQLSGGEDFNVIGMAFAGIPGVAIGRTEHIAWTTTTASGDNVDTYIETLCGAGAYLFQGSCVPFATRMETIAVRGSSPITITVARSVHGPVVASGSGVVFSQKRAHWEREIETLRPFLAFNRARTIDEFEAAVRRVITSHNFLYADRLGHIAYWQAGQVPVRPSGFDPRLPLPGDGSAEWPGGILPIPKSINPRQGFLANWNNKPSVDYNNADSQIFGKQFRLLDLVDHLARGSVSLHDMREIPQDIARVKELGREARYLKPYLLEALHTVRPAHPLAAQARAILQRWDGSAVDDAVESTSFELGEVIFSAWLDRMLVATFADELGASVGEAGTNMLLHVLDDALGGGSSVPPSRDYFNGVSPSVVMSNAFDQAVTALAAELGSTPSAWMRARGVVEFVHPVVGIVGSIPLSNRATYAQIVVLSQPKLESENIFTLGQSGFIRLGPSGGAELHPHYKDQLALFRKFKYKPMQLFRYAELFK